MYEVARHPGAGYECHGNKEKKNCCHVGNGKKKIGPLSNILYEKSKSIENWAAIAAAAQMKVS